MGLETATVHVNGDSVEIVTAEGARSYPVREMPDELFSWQLPPDRSHRPSQIRFSLLPRNARIGTAMSPASRFMVLAIAVAALVVQGNALAAQSISRDLLILPHLNGPVTLDGRSDEAAWQAIDPLPLIMYEPTYGGTPTERTELRVAYDDRHLYVAGRFYDSDPSGIRVNSLYRDRWSGDDTFGIVIDAFNDNENALSFWATPAGVRGDESLSNDAEGDANSSWNTYWDVATVITPKGWFGEMRIPFSSLGFQDDEGRVVMGFAVYRFIGRKNERQLFPRFRPTGTSGNLLWHRTPSSRQ